jgi:hypothetical protein
MEQFFEWLSDTSLGTAVRESTMLFPWFESVHVLALTIVVGSIAIVDLRLLGLTSRNRSVKQMLDEMLPITWSAFALAVITGLALFISQAGYYIGKTPMQVKLVLLVLAGVNMLVFHTTTLRTVGEWGTSPRPPAGARFAGATSLALWAGIVVFGRWIGFV